MPNVTIIITNNTSGCTEELSATTFVTGCTNYFVRIPENSTAEGPFDVYTGSSLTTPIYTSLSKSQLFSGVTISLFCP